MLTALRLPLLAAAGLALAGAPEHAVHHLAAPERAVHHVGAPDRLTVLDGSAHWTADRVVRLDGPVLVARDGTLRIDPGTRVEARLGAFIIVSREGRLDAAGTLTQPIVLTCTVAAKFPGCWGGVIVQGHARLNAGSATSLAGERGGAGGCRELIDPVVDATPFGGCEDADSSGVLRFARIEYAERGLQLQGVGRGTRVDHVQVNRARFEGVLVTGGAAQLRELFLTANGTGLRWTQGWRGAAQAIAIQQDVASFRAALVGQNTPTGDPDAEPRSAPTIFNATILAQSLPQNPSHATARALVLERGTAGALRNVFLYAPWIALDLADDATCLQLATGALTLGHLVTAGATALGEGTLPPACAETEATVLGDALRANQVLPGVGGLLRSLNDLLLPDLRPVPGSALATAAAATPPGGFLQGAPFVGAVPPLPLPAQIPWFSGWTDPAPTPAPIPNGVVTGVVRSPFRGLLAGITVRDAESGATAVSNASGAFSLPLPAGTVLLEAVTVPAECTLPVPQPGVVTPMTTTTLDLVVDCWPLPGALRVAVSEAFTCLVAAQGPHCFGDDTRGQLGNGALGASPLPVPLPVAFASITAGREHACGLTAGGAAWCWGANEHGQLGVAGGDRDVPTAIGGAPSFVVLSAGARHTCGLTALGTAWCWGDGARGQLGDGAAVSSSTPVPVAGGVPFATLDAGEAHTCALDRQGAAWCWGAGDGGALGDGGSADRSAPVPVATAERFGSVSAGGAHTCAVNGAGQLRCWGANGEGQLGDGTRVDRPIPVASAVGYAVRAVSAGGAHTCAVKTNGLGICWGANGFGQLGNDATAGSASVVTALNATSLSSLSAGAATSCAVTFGAVTGGSGNEVIISTRALLCWGDNRAGQFGSGTATSSLTPTPGAAGLTFP